jgi:putative hydrolase of the HAD superfamily
MDRIKGSLQNSIKGVFFDYGGVLENIFPDEASYNRGISIIRGIVDKIGIAITEKDLASAAKRGIAAYESWYRKNDYRELQNEELWTCFVLKAWCDTDEEICRAVEGVAENLSSIFEYYLYRHRPRRDLVRVVRTLYQNQYTLAIVSNTISRTLIPERLKRFGIDRYFTTVILSSVTGYRKPSGQIFSEALRYTGLKADQCMYIGDTLSRDVGGSHAAGFAKTVLLPSGLTASKDKNYRGNVTPDHTVESLIQIYDVL